METRENKNENKEYQKKPKAISDSRGNRYYAIPLSREDVADYLDLLLKILGDDFTLYSDNQQRRDGAGHYHITLLSVMEVDQVLSAGILSAEKLDVAILNWPIDTINLKGIGKSEKGSDTAYYVVVDCPIAQFGRKNLGLPHKDFHITLGFDKRDVHGIPKNEVKWTLR